MTRDEALNLVKTYTSNKNLIKHMLAVEAAMKAYAVKFGEDIDQWSVCGILHDVDYEKMKEAHPSEWGAQILRDKGVEEDIIDAIMAHGERDNPDSRPTKMAKALFAVDELTGFIVACALVRPNKLDDVSLESVMKSMKKKEFAKNVSRDDIKNGADEIGVTLEEHIQTVLNAMKTIKPELGL